jgi:glycolate oxidase
MDRAALIDKLRDICGEGGVFHTPSDLMVYEYDGGVDGAVETGRPVAVTLPTTTEQVAAIVKLAHAAGIPSPPAAPAPASPAALSPRRAGSSSP